MIFINSQFLAKWHKTLLKISQFRFTFLLPLKSLNLIPIKIKVTQINQMCTDDTRVALFSLLGLCKYVCLFFHQVPLKNLESLLLLLLVLK